jgi:hypothetical protein
LIAPGLSDRAMRFVQSNTCGRQQPRFIEERRRFEAFFPKSAGASIVGVRTTREVFVEAAHVPADIAEPLTPALDERLRDWSLRLVQFVRTPASNHGWCAEQLRCGCPGTKFGPGNACGGRKTWVSRKDAGTSGKMWVSRNRAERSQAARTRLSDRGNGAPGRS